MHAFAFGAPDESTWAVGWFPASGSEPPAGGSATPPRGVVVAPGTGSSRPLAATLTLEPGGVWHVAGEGIDVRLAEAGRAESEDGSPPDASQADRLVRAGGSFQLADGHEPAAGRVHQDGREPEWLGWSTSRPGLLQTDWESLHQAAAWFSEDDGLALTALHPRGARTRAEAVITAAVLGSGGRQAEDPRLSTTYGADGHVLRAGLELWLAHGEGDELYPLRASGEATGPPVAWENAGVSLEATPFRWYSRGRDGSGLYLVARR